MNVVALFHKLNPETKRYSGEMNEYETSNE